MARDTDTDWADIAEREPFYGVLTHPRFLRANLTEESLREFWRSGESDIAAIVGALREHLKDFTPGTALDFVCGVGRVTNAMAAHASEVLGVDISPGMLAEGRLHAHTNVSFANDFDGRTFDWVNSSIVLQHINPRVGFGLIEKLLGAVNPAGVISIHLTTYKDATAIGIVNPCIAMGAWDGERLRNLQDNPLPIGTMMMYDYDLTRVLMLLNQVGFTRVMLDQTYHGGNYGVTIYGRRQS